MGDSDKRFGRVVFFGGARSYAPNFLTIFSNRGTPCWEWGVLSKKVISFFNPIKCHFISNEPWGFGALVLALNGMVCNKIRDPVPFLTRRACSFRWVS